ncbi:ATP-binding protein [Nocardia nova]|uniref:ATP-binding protein n=1 Tax=Nocardia nova TaxID=37330 RepID=UPI0007A42A9B|nr:ATP-binding protein [Nocardia nova]
MTAPVLGDSRSDTARGATLEIDLDPITPARARAQVRELLASTACVAADDAILVFDELASNALRHGQGPRRCRISLHEDRSLLRIEVDDTGHGNPRPRAPDHTGGRGMILIDLLATAWGCTRFPEHKTVWATLTLARRRHRRPDNDATLIARRRRRCGRGLPPDATT